MDERDGSAEQAGCEVLMALGVEKAASADEDCFANPSREASLPTGTLATILPFGHVNVSTEEILGGRRSSGHEVMFW